MDLHRAPLSSRLSLSDVAGHLENTFPQFDDRLRSGVTFVLSDVPGSPIMKKRVIDEAGRMAAGVDLRRALAPKPALYSIGAGLAGIALAIVLALSFADYARIAISRLMLRSQEWPKRVMISVVKALCASCRPASASTSA